MKIYLALFILYSFSFSQVDTLKSVSFVWKDIQISPGNTVQKTKLMGGKALDLAEINVYAEIIPSAAEVHVSDVHKQYEEMIIVKDGLLSVNINDQKNTLGPGSMALVYPGDRHSYKNETDENVIFYVFQYKARIVPDLKRGEQAGGSFMIDWNDLEYKKSDIGGRRDYFRRATAMLNNFEMHVSTLNEGLTNHKAHTHKAEEFVLMIKGDVVMQVGKENYNCSAGDIVFVSSMVPHSLNNTGEGETMYFAFQLWQ